MKIGVVSSLFPGHRDSNCGIFVREEIDNLVRYHGCDFKVIAPLPNLRVFGEKRVVSVINAYPVIRPFVCAFSRLFMQKYYPVSLAYVLRKHADFFSGREIVHAHNAFPDAVAAVEAFKSSLPVIVTVHGSDINYFAQKSSLRKGIIDALNSADLIIAVSSDLARKVKDLGISTPVSVIHNGINTELFSPGQKENSASKLGLDPVRPRILFAGNFLPVKGIEYLIRAMPVILDRIPDCELVLLGARHGSGDMRLYSELIRSLGVYSSIKVVERVAHEFLPLWMSAADVFVLPSIHEGFGLVAAEALACGRPVVATRCGGPEDIVTGGTGYLVPPGDPDSLAYAVIQTIAGEGILNSADIAEYANKKFSYITVSQKIFNEYTRTLRK